MKLYFGVLSNKPARLHRVILRSALPGQKISVSDYPFYCPDGIPSEAFNMLLQDAENEKCDVAIICHDDMFFPFGWLDNFEQRINELPESWVIAGFYGINEAGEECGVIHDRRVPIPWRTKHTFPTQALMADGCCLVYNVHKKFRFDDMDEIFWYDTYAFLRAREMGTAWIIDCMPEHYCSRSFDHKPDDKIARPAWEKLKKRFPNQQVKALCYKD